MSQWPDAAPHLRACLSHSPACLSSLLAPCRPQLSLDPHLHDHVQPLYQAVRNKALTQYTAPFAALDLNAMAAFFSTSVGWAPGVGWVWGVGWGGWLCGWGWGSREGLPPRALCK